MIEQMSVGREVVDVEMKAGGEGRLKQANGGI